MAHRSRAVLARNPTFNAFTAKDINSIHSSHTNEQYEHQLSKRVEAYSTFEVVSSLIFGFSVSVLMSEVITEDFEDEILENLFITTLSLVLILSAYSLIVVSITHYFVNRFIADSKYNIANKYLSIYHKHRKYARWSFYISIIFLIIALAIFLFAKVSWFSTKCGSVGVLSIGAIFLSHTMYTMLNPNHQYMKVHRAYVRTVGSEHDEELEEEEEEIKIKPKKKNKPKKKIEAKKKRDTNKKSDANKKIEANKKKVKPKKKKVEAKKNKQTIKITAAESESNVSEMASVIGSPNPFRSSTAHSPPSMDDDDDLDEFRATFVQNTNALGMEDNKWYKGII